MNLTYRYEKNFLFDSNDMFKFLWFLPNFIFALIFTNPIFQAVLLANLVLIYLAANRIAELKKVLKFSFIFGLIALLVNILLRNDGNTPIIESTFSFPLFGKFRVTQEVLIITGILILQIILTFIFFGLINSLINPDNLMKAFVRLKMPYFLYLIFSISIRFTPLLIDDVGKISMVQKMRGLKLDTGSAYERFKNRIAIMMPLLINSLDRSIQLSEAIECRGFKTTAKRQIYNYSKMTLSHIILLVLHYLFVGTIIYYFITQRVGYWQIIPSLVQNPYQSGEIFFLLLLFSVNIIELLILWVRWKL